MALAINLTLVVQIGHFIIAYVLMRTFFLKPGYALVKQELDEKARLQQSLIDQETVVADTQLVKSERWRTCQTYFSEHKPAILEPSSQIVSSAGIELVVPLSAQELQKMTDEVAALLEKRIRHD